MIATAIALQEASKEAVYDETVVMMASALFHGRHEMNDDEYQRAIFMYSAHLSALATTLTLHACLTKDQIDEMIDTINEMETMGKDIE
jgi:L-asparaginase/Glu-tRNA(Gln) amidotransferase subunit D